MKKPFANNVSHRLWLWVGLCVVVIAALWATIFYPASLKRSGIASRGEFGAFQDKLKDAFSIFKKKTPAAKVETPDPEIQDLRERVFGDSIKRQ